MKAFLNENQQLIKMIADKYHTVEHIHENDHIFRFVMEHPSFSSGEQAIEYYFNDGQKSASLFMELIQELLEVKEEPTQVLEFASGYGRITRYLLNQERKLDITACDIHEEAVNFIKEKLSAKVLLSHTQPELFTVPHSYHVVFALSFFSHIPDSTWFRWLKTLYNTLQPGGLLIFTTHGYQSKKMSGTPELNSEGYWFAPGSEQLDLEGQDYGVTVVSPAYVCKKIELLPENPVIVRMVEGFWWGHQDLYIIRKGI
ncbi:methyltransferase [Bacillus pseudomycoides]|nr:methyltransferase [Bacillus pseudomycoides]